MAKKKIIIIGGGMAGMTAALIAAEGGAKVTVLERNDKIGKKILVTGNGRCNISNRHMDTKHYHSLSQSLFLPVYDQFNLEKTQAFMEKLGIDLIENEEGKLYPQSLQSSSVVKALLYRGEELGIDFQYQQRILKIEYTTKFRVYGSEKNFYGDYVLVATGGKSYSTTGSSGDGYAIAESFGHKIIAPMPSIVQLVTEGKSQKSLKGLKVEGKVQLIRKDNGNIVREEEGEILFTDYGLSGPTILQISTNVAPLLRENIPLKICIDFFPNKTEDVVDQDLINRFKLFPTRCIEQALNGYIHHRLIVPLLKAVGLDGGKGVSQITKYERQTLVSGLKNYTHQVRDTYFWNQAQVTKGGISCNEVCSTSLESLYQPQLYFAGEVLDMDGDCGGYNLQWAISSGAVVAKHILEKA